VILALRALGVGDLATAVPALRGLRAAFPGEELALAAPHWLRPLVDLVGGIDRLVPLDGVASLSGVAPPALPAPALAVNLHGRGPQSHRLLARLRPDRLWAYACPGGGHPDGPRWAAGEHEVRRWCRLLHWYGVPADPADLALRRPPPLDPGATIVHPGAKAADRRRPPDRFGAVARHLAVAGHRVVVTGTPAERGIAAEVAGYAGVPESAVLAGRTGLGDLAALVAHARLVVSGDTGIGHLATAYRTPSVLLFGPVPPAQWGPPPDRPWHRALWRGDVPGEDMRDGDPGPHPALTAIRVSDVLAAIGHVDLAEPDSHAAPTYGRDRFATRAAGTPTDVCGRDIPTEAGTCGSDTGSPVRSTRRAI